jgi:hypothetical protein
MGSGRSVFAECRDLGISAHIAAIRSVGHVGLDGNPIQSGFFPSYPIPFGGQLSYHIMFFNVAYVSTYFKDHGSVDSTFMNQRQAAADPATSRDDRVPQGPPSYRLQSAHLWLRIQPNNQTEREGACN